MTDTMFSSRVVPWMSLGALTESVKTAAEAAELGGLNFEVEQRPLEWVGEDGARHAIARRRPLVRRDYDECHSSILAECSVRQLCGAFDFMAGVDPDVAAAGGLTGGRQGFRVVRSPKLNVRGGDDPHDRFIRLRTRHDG